jgi:hypothetical protein
MGCMPRLEVVTVTQPRGPADDEAGVRHKPQVDVVPGFTMRPRPGVTWLAGFQVPVTTAKAFAYQLRSGLVVACERRRWEVHETHAPAQRHARGGARVSVTSRGAAPLEA